MIDTGSVSAYAGQDLSFITGLKTGGTNTGYIDAL